MLLIYFKHYSNKKTISIANKLLNNPLGRWKYGLIISSISYKNYLVNYPNLNL